MDEPADSCPNQPACVFHRISNVVRNSRGAFFLVSKMSFHDEQKIEIKRVYMNR